MPHVHFYMTASLIFIATLLIGYCLVPLAVFIGVRLHIMDVPSPLSIHTNPTPRTGGIIVFGSMYLAFAAVHFFLKNIPSKLFLFGMMYFILGFVDDKFGLSPRIRLICQSLISSILLLLINPIRFSGVIIVDFCINLGILVLFINAINFWDGMNGLSGCTAILYGILLFGAGFVQKNHYIMILSAMLVGGTIPFLIKNMPEGKIFLGDGGAYFIAFVLYLLIHMAVASISSMTNKSLAFIFFLNVPFYDAVFACFRRIKNKINITMGDRSHLYDLLIKRGSSSSQVIMILISLMSAFGTAALLLYGFPDMTIIAGFFLFCFYVFISIKLGSLRII